MCEIREMYRKWKIEKVGEERDERDTSLTSSKVGVAEK